ncbi:FAD-dependent thymidylate synthase, partial [Caminibacter pacificus]
MNIKILDLNYKPTDIAVGSARSCYFGKHIVTPENAAKWDKKNELLDSIFKAGHHTTLMHYHFTVLIEGMSRLLIWRMLHSHPFYNSEQVSQRYAKMKIENFTYPKNADKEKWKKYYEKMFFYYEELIEKLTPEIEKVLPKFKKKEAKKRAQEFARYLLPQGMNAHLYHTINVITALRYIAAAKVMPEANEEAKEFAKKLEIEMLRIDENLAPLIEFAKNEKVVFPKIDIEKIKKAKNIGDERVKVFDIVDYDFELNENFAGVMRLSSMLLDESILGGFNSYIKLSL